VVDHWLDGDAELWGVDFVYKLDSPAAYGRGDLAIQGEYIARRLRREVVRHDLEPELVGRTLGDDQDGLYLQLVYGFAPRWRAGVRYDAVGLANRTRFRGGGVEERDVSEMFTVMCDFSGTEFSRWRLGVSRADLETGEGPRSCWALMMQLQVSLGVHGAHKF